jgi:hypothetical protein
MKKEGYYSLEGTIGYLLKKIPQDIYTEVKDVVDNIQNNFDNAQPYNSNLAGQIDKEYETQFNPKLTQYIKSISEEYTNLCPEYIHNIQRDINTLMSYPVGKPYDKNVNLSYKGHSWVNFQKKYEYNPIHRHSGVFSFVIWYKIPFYKEDEVKYGAGKDRGPEFNHNGEFEFIYTSGKEKDIQFFPLSIDKKMEGYMAMFPSNLRHIVYPFYTSDDYRITLSGNIDLQINV